MKIKCKLKSCAALAAVLTASPAIVGQAAAQGDAASGDSDVIIVTARKRDERLIDVPLSITAFSTEDLQNADIQSIEDIARFTPNFSLATLGNRLNDSPTVRGLTSNLGNRDRQSASFFVDGVYVSGSVSSISMSDIQRVEVLKGPQSVLFGRATFAGAVNFVTKDPSNEFEADFSALYAQHDSHELTGSVSGPLVQDKLFFRLGARSYKYGGEYHNHLVDPTDTIGDESTWSVSGSVIATPTDNFRAKLNVAYSEDDDGPNLVYFVNGTCADDNPGVISRNIVCGQVEFDELLFGRNYEQFAGSGFKEGLGRELLRTSLRMDWDIPNHTITSITAYNTENSIRGRDADSLATQPFAAFSAPGGDIAQVADAADFDDFSQEIRIISTFDSPFQYLAGFYYLDAERARGRDFPGPSTFNPDVRRESTDWAIFGSLSYDVTEQLNLTFEGRYQESEFTDFDMREGGAPLVLGNGQVAEAKFTKFLPRATVSYSPTDNSTLYAYWAKGNRPGSFNTDPRTPLEDTIVDEENVEIYEIGAKGSFFDGALNVSTAGFYQQVDDQVNFEVIIPMLPQLPFTIQRNTGDIEIWGAELEAAAQLSENFSVQGSLGYTDAEIVKGGSSTLTTVVAAVTSTAGNLDGVGNVPANAPKWNAAIGGTYEHPITADHNAFVRGDLLFKSSIFATDANLTETGDSTRINLRGGVRSDMWSLEVFVLNVTDDDTPRRLGSLTNFGVSFLSPDRTGTSVVAARGRQFGVRTRINF